MSDSRKRKQVKLQEKVGDAGKVRVEPNRDGYLVYRVNCRVCPVDAAHRPWTTYRTLKQDDSPTANGYTESLARWEAHVTGGHVDDRMGPPLGAEDRYLALLASSVVTED